MKIEIARYTKNVRKEGDLVFSLKLVNSSGKAFAIPKNITVLPHVSIVGEIGYEVLYCAKDTVSFTELYPAYYCGNTIKTYDRVLKPGDEFVFSTKLNSMFFHKKGVYKVRFFTSRRLVNDRRGANDLSDATYTDWAYLTAGENVWPFTKEGLEPVSGNKD